jgi:o-succinylbenzoate---CoA ligase
VVFSMELLHNININGKEYNRNSLLQKAEQMLNLDCEEWELNFWKFISNWLDVDAKSIEIYTSGSTGKPKAIQISKERMLASASMTCSFFDLSNDKTALLCLPVTGIGGLMMVVRAFYCGMNLIMVKPSSLPLQNINQPIDFVSMVPFQVANTMENTPEKFDLIKTMIIGGGTISKELENHLMEKKVNAYHTFGMTETITHIAVRKIGEKQFTTLEGVVPDIDNENRLKITAPHLLSEPLQTNDIVELIGANHFVWLGRYDNAIETGGVKVLPEVVEEKLQHLIPHRFFIASIPHSKLNNEVVLVVEAKDFSISQEEMKACLFKYEVPKKLFLSEKFIETESGKIKRKESLQSAFEVLD